MRRLIVTENLSVNGVAAPMDGWFDPKTQAEDSLAINRQQREAADALVLGRVTYQEFAEYWPAQRDDKSGISDYLNRVAKYVVSGSLERAVWENTTILRGPIESELAALKQRQGRDIVVTGSVSLVHSLVPSGLIDIYRLFVHPAVQGHGRRLFPDKMKAALQLVEAKTFSSGVVLMVYRTEAL